MRCRLVTGLATLVVLGTISTAAADILKGELMIAPRVSVYLPVGDYPITGPNYSDYKDKVKIGFAFGALVDKVVTDKISVGVQVGYNISKMNTTVLRDAMKPYNAEPDFKWKTMQLTGHVRYHLNPAQPLSFFGHLGAGLYVNKFSTDIIQRGTGAITVPVPQSQTFTSFGVNAGPGLLVRLSPSTRFTFEALLHNVFTPNQSLRYLNLTAGFVFSLPPE